MLAKKRTVDYILLLLLLAHLSLFVQANEEQRIRAIESAKPSVVSIRTKGETGSKPGIGSGIIFRSDGFILTNHHVIKNAKVVQVSTDKGKTFTASVWKSEPDYDLALLKINTKGLPVARIGNSDNVRLGQTAIAIGDPLGFTGTVTIGTVGGIGRDVKAGGVNYKKLIQTDASINPGSSGGALINLNGEVIGVNTLVYNGPSSYKHAQGLGFAIPINSVVSIARKMVGADVQTGGKAWLGITGESLARGSVDAERLGARSGVIVRTVTSGGPAAIAGIKQGDVLVQMGDDALRSVKELAFRLNQYQAGDYVNFVLIRRGERKRVTVKLHGRIQ